MSLDVKPCPLTPQTLDSLEQVLRDAPTERERLTSAVDTDGARLFQAVFNGRNVGVLLLLGGSDSPRVETLVVHPATRGRGVGRALIEQAGLALGTEPALPTHCHKSKT